MSGSTRAPWFGEWMRNTFASEDNPQRDGMYVRTIRRTGFVNPGAWFEITDGKGSFWECKPDALVPIEGPRDAELTRQRDRLRAVVHILNEVVPLDGPKDAEEVARLAVDEVTRLRAELERVRTKRDQLADALNGFDYDGHGTFLRTFGLVKVDGKWEEIEG